MQERIPGEGKDVTRFGQGGFTNNEHTSNNRSENQLNSYFSKLTQKLASFDEILLFGPANAKKQFHNYLLSQKSFQEKKIDVKNTDKLTPNQEVAFAKEYLEVL